MNKNHYWHKLLFGTFAVLLAFSCSTEKDALLNKGYHNMTARFNGYYNAGVIIEETMEGFREEYQEDLDKLISIKLYPGEEEAAAMFPQMDDAIERCSKVILRHSMPNPEVVSNKKTERCRWIDDNWLVIGEAHYIKREYEEAKEKFKYVSESSFYRSEPSVYAARIWLAKTHIALGEYTKATRVLINVEQSMNSSEADDGKKEKKGSRPKSKYQRKKARESKKKEDDGPAEFPKKLKKEYELAMAELYIAKDEKKKATVHLENAIKLCRKRKERARYQYVLAQLYSELGNDQMAAANFDKVARSSVKYEMRFKAKIKNALTATGNEEETIDELEKMLKDGKNLEYRDQIYYALGELDRKKARMAEAKGHYSKSVLWSVQNDRQKGISYLRLADIHFDEKDYLKAQKYYDSCVQVLPEDYEGYEKLKNKAEGLADLVFHYETVTFEDSVQRIGGMDPKAREKYLKDVIKQIEKEEERKRLEEEQRLLQQQERINNQQVVSGKGKKWYFSNPKIVAQGFNEFRLLWGQRVSEDNWRRANKNSISNGGDGEIGEVTDTTEVEGLTVEQLMEDIPVTQSALDSSNYRMLNSMYNLGLIYKDQLKEEKEAIVYFDAVIDKNIEHPKVLPSMYQLYLLHNRKGNTAKADQYKNMIIKRYPDSEIAQILNDPEFLKKKNAKEKEELTAYSNTLRNYRRRSYGLVITKCNEVISQDKDNTYLGKYYLLKAYSVSQMNTGNIESVKQPLQELYAKSPNSEEGIQAKIYLDQIAGGDTEIAPDQEAEKSPYVFEEDSKHFFVLAIPTQSGNVNGIKVKISNFNSEFFRTESFTIQDAPLGSSTQLLVVRSFDDLVKAKIYLKSFLSDNSKGILENTASEYDSYLISPKNFSELFRNKNLEGYSDFYKKNY